MPSSRRSSTPRADGPVGGHLMRAAKALWRFFSADRKESTEDQEVGVSSSPDDDIVSLISVSSSDTDSVRIVSSPQSSSASTPSTHRSRSTRSSRASRKRTRPVQHETTDINSSPPTQTRKSKRSSTLSAPLSHSPPILSFETHWVTSSSEVKIKFTVPAGRYENIEYLSSGTFGAVVTAVRRSDGARVVLKKQGLESGAEAEAALREVKTLAHLSRHAPHPNVIALLDAWLCCGERVAQLYMVCERLDTSLSGIVQEYAGKPVPLALRTKAMIGMLAGLRHLHGCNLIHRDLKPGNVVMNYKPSVGDVRLIDMGTCRTHPCRNTDVMTTGKEVTTYPYRSPETVREVSRYESKVDMWSAGCILAELLTGSRLFTGCEASLAAQQNAVCDTISRGRSSAKLRALFPSATAAERTALVGLLQRDPAKRFSAAQALEVLDSGSASQVVVAKMMPMPPLRYKFDDLREMTQSIAAEAGGFHQRQTRSTSAPVQLPVAKRTRR